MKIVRHKSTFCVLYMFADAVSLVLDADGLHGPVRAADVNTSSHEIVTDVPAPQFFAGGALSYTGQAGWQVYDMDLYDAAWEQHLADVDAERARIWEQIKRIRDHKTQSGGYPAGGKWFHSDVFSRSQQMGMVMMGQTLPAGIMWKTMDGSFIEMTPTLAQQVFQSAATQDAALFQYAETLRELVDASEDPASIDINAGWPAVFGG